MPDEREPVVSATETATEPASAPATPEPEPTPEPMPEPTPEPEPSAIDLDDFLNTQTGNSPAPRIRVALPEADRMAVVGILADDSGSMRDLTTAVLEGLNLSIEAFRGAKGSDFHLDVRGFKQPYFRGMLRDVKPDSFNDYNPDYFRTPLVRFSISHLTDLRSQASQYRSLGIPTTVALLIITDGLPEGDDCYPEQFQDQLDANDFVVAMGISPRSDDRSDYIRQYQALFEKMGITQIVTPNSAAAEVRHAINQFSQSVASIANA